MDWGLVTSEIAIHGNYADCVAPAPFAGYSGGQSRREDSTSDLRLPTSALAATPVSGK
jgi:hypothetical protein